MSLPWEEVNRRDPQSVAPLVGLVHSRDAGAPQPEARKWQCPVCGSRDGLSAAKRVFFCFAGCGWKRFTNVDIAMVQWGLDSADACKALARELNITVHDDPPPFQQVAATAPADVLALLGLQAAPTGKYPCPVCRQAELRICKSVCRCDHCDEWYNHVDLAMRVWGMQPAEACREIGHRLGLTPAPVVRSTPPPRAVEPSAREALAALEDPVYPEAVYRRILDSLSLGPEGQAELARRRIRGVESAAYGVRSITQEAWRQKILPWLSELRGEELRAAGFPRETKRGRTRVWIPWGGRAPLLVLPYRRAGQIISLRFRNLNPDDVRRENRQPKYFNLKEAPPEWPFHSSALSAREVHITEGEINALVLGNDLYRLDAAGQPGAGIWKREWTEALAGAERIVYWADADKAGWAGSRIIRNSLDEVYGPAWREARWRRLLMKKDASDLHRDHQLTPFLGAEPWLRPEALDTDTDPSNPYETAVSRSDRA